MKPEIAIIARVGAHKAFEAVGLTPYQSEVYATPYGDSRPVHRFRHEGGSLWCCPATARRVTSSRRLLLTPGPISMP